MKVRTQEKKETQTENEGDTEVQKETETEDKGKDMEETTQKTNVRGAPSQSNPDIRRRACQMHRR